MFGGSTGERASSPRPSARAQDASGVVERVLDAALASIAQQGIAKTTLGDLARSAGCSRATLYRLFPGGKDEVLDRLGARELWGFLAEISGQVDAATDLEGALVAGLSTATRHLRAHQALQHLLEHEPEWVLPYFGFHQLDRLFAACRRLVGPGLERFVPPTTAAWAAEWCARLVMSHAFMSIDDDEEPVAGLGPARVDLGDEASARRLVRTFLLPALVPDEVDLRPSTPPPTSTTALQGSPA